MDPRLFSHPDDVDHAAARPEARSPGERAAAFARYRALEVQPGAVPLEDDAALVDYMRRAAATVHHPCGSCRMGPDAQSVVNEQLQVHGIEGLRVADASVFPRLVGGNTNAAVVMIAEKAADMIRGIAAPPRARAAAGALGVNGRDASVPLGD